MCGRGRLSTVSADLLLSPRCKEIGSPCCCHSAYIVGRMLIGFASSLVVRALERQKVEPTIIRYVGSLITIALNIILIVAILGYFGVETTSFAALVAGLGIAVRPAFRCMNELREHRLERVLRDWAPPAIPVHIVYPSARHVSAKVKSFVEYVQLRMTPPPGTSRDCS